MHATISACEKEGLRVVDAYDSRDSGAGIFPQTEAAPDLSHWFSVSGDIDDFIYYDVPENTRSEK